MENTDTKFSMLEDAPAETSISEVLDILRRRRKIVIAAVCVFLAAGIALSFLPRKYVASGQIRVQPGSSSEFELNPLSMMSSEYDDKIGSEVKILQSRDLYLQVGRELKLIDNRDFWGISSPKFHNLDSPVARDVLFRRMDSRIKIKHTTKDEIIQISCKTNSPQLSASIVNTLVNDYIQKMFQMHYGATNRASSWMLGQLNDIKSQLETSQSELVQLQKQLGVIVVDENTTDFPGAASLDEIYKSSIDATVARIEAEAKYRYLKDANPGLIEGEVNLMQQGSQISQSGNSLIQNLRNAEAQASVQYSQLLTQFGPNYPTVKEQKAHLDEIRREVKVEQARILNQAKVAYDASVANENLTRGLLDEKRNEAFGKGNDLVKYAIVRQNYEANRMLYQDLVQHLREAVVTAGMEGAEIDIVDTADLPGLPAQPGPVLFILGGLLGGVFLGSFLALLLEAFDTRINSLEQAERACGSPLLSVIPHLSTDTAASPGDPAIVLTRPKSRYAEAIQTLRTSILLAKPGKAPKVIMVTSPLPADGKSTTSINLAATFAQHRSRVILVDADLRLGKVGSKLGLRMERGLSEVLSGQASLDSVLQTLPALEGVTVLVGGRRPPEPAVLLGSTEMRDLVDELANRFDLIIFDCAPVLGLSDVFHLGNLAEALLIVIRFGQSRRKAVQQARKQLNSAQLPVLGFMLNDVDAGSQSYGYGYGYGYGYSDYYVDDSARTEVGSK